MDDPRIARFVAIGLALKSLGLTTRDALVSAAHLENAEHLDSPRWEWVTRSELA